VQPLSISELLCSYEGDMKSEIFPKLDDLYSSKNPLVRNLFWGRINTALSLAEIKNNSVVLDVGCGSGHLMKAIRKYNSECECYATDVQDYKITEAVKCKFQIADVKKLPFEDNKFNLVFALDVLEHIRENVGLAIKEIHRILRPDGSVILSGPTESWSYRFCRSLLFYFSKESAHPARQEIDFHYHTIYHLESEFVGSGFILSVGTNLPGFPLPTLFRIVRFQKQS
jgi:ubiquinone/menaquinone biosynthesis C-methylase UbiE